MKILRLICALSLMMGMCSLAAAEQSKRIATIAQLSGTAEVKSPQGKWMAAKVGTNLTQGDIIRTKANSEALLNLDGMAQTATVQMKANSQLKISELMENKPEKSQTTLLDLALGQVLIEAKKLHSEKSKFEVKTPTSIVAVRGTSFSVNVEALGQ